MSCSINCFRDCIAVVVSADRILHPGIQIRFYRLGTNKYRIVCVTWFNRGFQFSGFFQSIAASQSGICVCIRLSLTRACLPCLRVLLRVCGFVARTTLMRARVAAASERKNVTRAHSARKCYVNTICVLVLCGCVAVRQVLVFFFFFSSPFSLSLSLCVCVCLWSCVCGVVRGKTRADRAPKTGSATRDTEWTKCLLWMACAHARFMLYWSYENEMISVCACVCVCDSQKARSRSFTSGFWRVAVYRWTFWSRYVWYSVDDGQPSMWQ